jgi:sec-independent protein translocase protein TatC
MESKSKTDAKSFIEHFEELRRTIFKCLAAIIVLFVPSFLVSPEVINFLISWSCPPELAKLNYFSPMEVFIIQMKLAAVISIAASFPFWLWQVWRFLLPALYEKERKALKWWVSASVFLFALGAFFCIALILPMIMKFSAGFASGNLQPVISLSAFLNLSGWLVLAFGAMFQFPIAVMLAVRFGFVKYSFLADKRPYIVILILIIAAVLTPPDVVSQIMLAVPTYLLFEIGLFFSRGLEKKKEAAARPQKPEDNAMLDFYIEEENKKHVE